MANGDYGEYVELMLNPNVKVDGLLTGVVNISGSSVNVTGPSVSHKAGFTIKAHPGNNSTVFFVNTGGYSASGFPLTAGQSFFVSASNLGFLDFGVFGSGSGVICWAKM